MIIGTLPIPLCIEESHCRNTKDYYFTEIGDYHIHSTSLMPNIEFGESEIQSNNIDDSIFINDEETKPKFAPSTKCQNYLTCKYVGRAPLEWYSKENRTQLGREFVLICRDGDSSYQHRIFGTEDAIHGYNRNANESVAYVKEAP